MKIESDVIYLIIWVANFKGFKNDFYGQDDYVSALFYINSDDA